MDYQFQIFHSTFFFLLFRGLAIDIPGKWIEKKLWENDILKHKVRLRPYSVVLHSVDMTFFFGALIVSIVHKQAICIAFFSLANAGYVLYLVDVCSKSAHYSKKYIYLKSLRKERVISVAAITNICWELPRRGIGYLLVIYLDDGSRISLASTEYIGLRELSKLKPLHEK